MTYSEATAAIARTASRKSKRLERVAENRELAYKSIGKAPRTHVRRRKVSSRRRAFNRLKAACKRFVLLRNSNTRNGMCEIKLSCGGENVANTWYHGWPQNGGNGLKYNARSHFASCGPCNMGEYGSRMAGSSAYINRHKELLGDSVWNEINSLHGRRKISTAEANETADEYERRIENGEWD